MVKAKLTILFAAAVLILGCSKDIKISETVVAITPTPSITPTNKPTVSPTPTFTPIPTVSPTPIPIKPSDEDIEYAAKTICGEAPGCTKIQKAAVVWVIINRIESEWFPNTVKEVVTQPKQFQGYREFNDPSDEDREIAEDVLTRWLNGWSGRIIPSEYLFFHSGKGENIFTTEHLKGIVWDFSFPNIYAEDHDGNMD